MLGVCSWVIDQNYLKITIVIVENTVEHFYSPRYNDKNFHECNVSQL